MLKSNIALNALDSSDYRNTLPGYLGKHSFRNSILPAMMDHIKDKISESFVEARRITIIVDIWSTQSCVHFLGLAAYTIDESLKTNSFMVGMVQMGGKKCAEHIKKAIEIIINDNEFKFDRSKIMAVVCDEGKNILKLFSQLNENELEIDDEIDNESLEEGEDEFDLELIEQRHQRRIEKEISEYSSIQFANKIAVSRQPLVIEYPNKNPNDGDIYDLTKGDPTYSLELEIRDNKVARYPCAAHKLNIVVRRSIVEVQEVESFMNSLSNHVGNVKRSTVNSKRHADLNCRLHGQNFTRWNSTFKMLYSFSKSYRRGIFDDKYKCPQSQNDIDDYLQILYPLYQFSLNIQSKNANISLVLPSILAIIYANLERFVLNDEVFDDFRKHLIMYMKYKFDFELRSPIYIAAALLNTDTLSFG